jgi:hypothetical protein
MQQGNRRLRWHSQSLREQAAELRGQQAKLRGQQAKLPLRRRGTFPAHLPEEPDHQDLVELLYSRAPPDSPGQPDSPAVPDFGPLGP